MVSVEDLGIFRSSDMDRTHHQNQTYNVQLPSLPENTRRPNNPGGDLWGATTRSVVSFVQICYGIIEIAVITAFIALSVKTVRFIDLFAIIEIVLSFICAVVLIIAGGFGRCSRQDGCKVIAYLVLNASSAICGAFCLVFGGFTLVDIIQSAEDEEWPNGRRVTGIAMSSALLVTFLLHMVISIVGASFTCGAVCDCNTQNSSRRRYRDYNNQYRPIQGQDSLDNPNPITPLLQQPNAPPVNEVLQPPSYGTL